MTTPVTTTAPKGSRVPVIDWLRGFAVVTMIVAHSFDAWMDPALRTGASWAVVRHVSGIPSRLFLFLVGVSAAVVFSKQVARGASEAEMRRYALQRGFGMLALAYLFRLQEHILANFWGGWSQVLRVDILNCIAVSLLLLGLVGVPRRDGSVVRPRVLLPLALAAIFVAFGAIIGPAVFPDFIPRALSSYIGGQRPMAWFPLFPWGAWALVGLVIGQLWLRESRKPDQGARCFNLTGLLGVLSLGTVLLIRELHPQIIRYPSELVQQMGPGSFFFRLGAIGVIAFVGFHYTRLVYARRPGRFSPLAQLGQSSLLIYWIHVEICYGFGTRPIQKQLGFVATTIAFLILTAAMLGLSLAKTRHWPAIAERLRALRGRAKGGAPLPPEPTNAP